MDSSSGLSYRFTVQAVHGKERGRTFVPKGGRFPVTTTPEKTRNFEALVKHAAFTAGVKPMGCCNMHIDVCIPMREQVFKTKPCRLLEPRKRPDLDNVVKSVCDALNGIAYRDDKDVLEMFVRYRFIPPDEAPRTEVEIHAMEWTEAAR